MLFVCRTEVENHVLFIIENIWRLVIMARRIGMDIKILMAKMLFMIFDMHATLSEDKYESVLTTLELQISDYQQNTVRQFKINQYRGFG